MLLWFSADAPVVRCPDSIAGRALVSWWISGLLAFLLVSPEIGLAREKPLTLVAVGDVNLNRSRVDVQADGVDLWGKIVEFDEPLTKIRKHINGDLNFCNLETTVMDKNDIEPADKKYNFKTHPNGVRAMQDSGFNLMAIANNHMRDYGPEGIKSTREWLDKLGKEKDLWYAGAGMNIEEATEPAVFKINGIRVAFSAVSNSRRAKKKRAGVASAYSPEPALEKLKNAEADIRILSMHVGEEKSSTPVSAQFHCARNAIKDYDVDIVIGHHPHVVQGIEIYKGGIIFYSLGNFCMRGARNMGSVKEFHGERDFGLLVKLDMVWDTKKKKVKFKKLEALPVYDMHSGPHPFKDDDEARERIEAVNRFSTSKHLGSRGEGVKLEFEDGRGVFDFEKKVEEKKKEKKKEEKKKEEKKSE